MEEDREIRILKQIIDEKNIEILRQAKLISDLTEINLKLQTELHEKITLISGNSCVFKLLNLI